MMVFDFFRITNLKEEWELEKSQKKSQSFLLCIIYLLYFTLAG